MSRRRRSLALREYAAFYGFVAPWLIGLLVFTLYPLLASLYYSLTDFNGVEMNFIGLENYVKMFSQPLFYQSLWVTVRYAVVVVPLNMVAALALALLMNQQIPLLSFWRTLYFLPSIISGVASAMLWRWILNPDMGLLNSLLMLVNIESPRWFWDERWALPAYWLMSLWSVGGSLVIYLAGLQGVPTALYEAAELDGANAWQRLTRVTLPMISPVLLFSFITNLISSFQIFTQVFVISGQGSGGGISLGGPNNSTLMYVLYLISNGIRSNRLGYGSALSWVLFLIIMALTMLFLRLSQRLVYYEDESVR
ncbi:MAG: sugar ABC transporter permease [Anaerolineae bacterium]|nr:sugar ABC transporter permease [Anaerolineae bacterium]